jgi:hypothetical protein
MNALRFRRLAPDASLFGSTIVQATRERAGDDLAGRPGAQLKGLFPLDKLPVGRIIDR